VNKLILFLISGCLFLSLQAEADSERKELQPPKIKKDQIIDSSLLLKEVEKLKNLANLVKSTTELKYIKATLIGTRFYFQNTVSIKSNELISGERILWFKKMGEKSEIKLEFDKKNAKSYELIQEDDFVSAVVELVEIDNYVEFKFLKLINIEPFDLKAKRVSFHNEFEKLKILKKKIKFTEYRDNLKSYSFRNKKTLGYLSGLVTGISLVNDVYVMKMEVNGFKTTIKCHPKYTKFLAEMEMNTKHTMVVLLDSINEKDEGFFSRGCNTSWIDP
jgi:hypothetical protein